MAIKTQGTELYVIDPDDSTVLTVGCPTAIDGIDTEIDQIETTCLSADARTYVAGLATPGNATFTIQFDPSDASHVRMHELKLSGQVLQWAIGFSDGTDDPTPSTGGDGFDNDGTNRSWIEFSGYMSSYPFSFALNDVVESQIGIQVSGEPTVVPKVAP